MLSPFTNLVSLVLATAHSVLSSLGLDPVSGLTWALSIVVLVVTVRVALLPLTVHGVRLAHSSAKARPALHDLRRRYEGRRDVESLRRMRAEQREIQSEHRVSTLGCLPMLLQLPVLYALYRVLSQVASGQAIGAMDLALVASAGSASLLGVGLAQRLSQGATLQETLLIGGLGLAAAAISYATQRWLVLPNTVLDGLPEPMLHAQQVMPLAAAIGVLVAAATVPAGLVFYWFTSNLWTLGQQAVITRWFPTPGSPAQLRRQSA